MGVGENIGGTVGIAAATAGYKGMHLLLPKAKLYVPKASDNDAMNAMNEVVGETDMAALAALNKAKKQNAQSAVAATGFTATLKQVGMSMPFASMAKGFMEAQAITAAMAQGQYNVMEVQYNPRSINISANGGNMLVRPAAGDNGATQTQITSNVMRINFTVDLVFEAINVADAFHLEGLSMNAEELARTAASTVYNTFGDGYSVQNQCDGLLALLNFKRLKQVVFVWSNMFFHGELTNVDVSYEMFNKLGHPILAKVRLVIQQIDSTKSVKYVSDDGQWETAFDIAFEGSSTKFGKFGS
ncbi:MAG: hypothetical protein K6B14_03185 [Lachnospiraceae bacterium]|nr:hypothetical protein [Lachnospiraceae bacterium]